MSKFVIFLATIFTCCCGHCITSTADTSRPDSHFNAATIADELQSFVTANFATEYDGEIVTELLQKDFGHYLQPCSMPLNYYMSEHTTVSNRLTVKVVCSAAPAWTLYVPVMVKIYQPVVITTKPMSKDELITPDAITTKNIDIISLHHGFFADPESVVGHVVKFPCKAGNVLTTNSIAKYKLVKRGDRVNINIEDPELTINMQGESLEDGGLGDYIKVRNISSKRIVEATIVAPGKVQIHI